MLSSRIILRSQYFVYFGILGLYLPYFNLYCYHLGFSGAQIGYLAGLRWPPWSVPLRLGCFGGPLPQT